MLNNNKRETSLLRIATLVTILSLLTLYPNSAESAVTYDSVTTWSGLQLIVGSDGSMGAMGNGGVGTVNMDFTHNPTEWQPSWAKIYLYSGGQIVGWRNDSDTAIYWGLNGTTETDPVGLIPSSSMTHTTNAFADIVSSGEYTTADGSIGMTSTWYAPNDPGASGEYILKITSVYSKAGTIEGVVLGEVIDWDVPGDQAVDRNWSSFDGGWPYHSMAQVGYELSGWNDAEETAESGWDSDKRYGVTTFLGSHKQRPGFFSRISNKPWGMYVVDNATYTDPFPLGFNPDSLFILMSQGGATISDSLGDLHTGISYLNDYDLSLGDTLIFLTVYASTMDDGSPGGVSSFGTSAENFITSNGIIPGFNACCVLMGDVNYDGAADISDLTYFVDYLFRGGPDLPCKEQADRNQDCQINIDDLVWLVNIMFRGIYPVPWPQECHYCPNWH